jgi:hypothetical protein
MVKKSRARTLAACWRRNSRQLGPVAPRRGRQAGRQHEPPDGAQRDARLRAPAVHLRSAGSPGRTLPRQAQNKVTNATLDRRRPPGPLRLRPAPPYELSLPAKERLWCHDQPVPTSTRKDPAERGEECAIGCSKRRPWLHGRREKERSIRRCSRTSPRRDREPAHSFGTPHWSKVPTWQSDCGCGLRGATSAISTSGKAHPKT